MGTFRDIALATATAAILATSVTPAAAAVSLDRDKSVLKASGEYNDWGRRDRYRHHGRGGGGLLAGLAVLAGVAVVASAASKNSQRNRDAYPYPPERYPDNRPIGTSGDYRSNDIGSAVEACSYVAERNGGRVDEIRSVSRDGAGWRVVGYLSGADDGSFTCGATNGEVDFVEFGDRGL